MSLSDFKVLTFDCYGTLVDWEGGILHALAPLAARASRTLTPDAILEAHAVHESSQQRSTPQMPYRDLLAVVCKRLAEEWGVPATWEACQAYGRSVGDWPVFPDTVEALRYLKRFYKLVILSNVDNQTFAASNRALGVEFDAIYAAEDIGAYKPSHENFRYMLEKLERLAVAKGQILHTAESMFHDHAPAKAMGLSTCWIHRRHGREGFGATMHPGEIPPYDYRFTSLGEFAKAHAADLQSREG